MGSPAAVLFVSLLFLAAASSPAFSAETCRFPAIFNFGDSNSDTGGLPAAYSPLAPPYGETYFHMPAGRVSDGRLIIDFMAMSFGLPFLHSYLDSMGSNFSNGVNFAVSSSTITPQDFELAEGGFSPFYLDIQIRQFTQVKLRSQRFREQGGIFAGLMPKKEYFPNALYTLDIGQNDLAAGFRKNLTVPQINDTVPGIINRFKTNVKTLYDNGARHFWIHGTGPIGCLPYFQTHWPTDDSEKDDAGCTASYNNIAKYFNVLQKEAIHQLRKELPLASITLVDIYSIKYSLYSESPKNGFVYPLVGCCGYGGKYNHGVAFCGATVTVNGTTVFGGACKDPSVRVNWDGIHYTEAANRYVFNKIATGAFSDPPNVKPSTACYKPGPN